jgi:ketosteroid isomerase-like protein
MKALFALPALAALLAAAPLAAEPSPEHAEVTAAVDAFFDALRSDDKRALAQTMDPQGLITIHNRMDPAAPKILFVPVAKHLENWLTSPPGLDERMIDQSVLIEGDMAQVWGPYRFMAGGKTSHCGVNSLSLVKQGGAWKIANTSFSMVPPDQCEGLGAPEAAAP